MVNKLVAKAFGIPAPPNHKKCDWFVIGAVVCIDCDWILCIAFKYRQQLALVIFSFSIFMFHVLLSSCSRSGLA